MCGEVSIINGFVGVGAGVIYVSFGAYAYYLAVDDEGSAGVSVIGCSVDSFKIYGWSVVEITG